MYNFSRFLLFLKISFVYIDKVGHIERYASNIFDLNLILNTKDLLIQTLRFVF